VNKFQSEVGEGLRGGDAGVRLVEPSPDASSAGTSAGAANTGPEGAPCAPENEWLLVPLYHIFGSEELSRWAPGIAELSPDPYIAMNRDGAARFGAEVECLGYRVPVKVEQELPDRIAGIPAGVPPFAGFPLPLRARITNVP